MRETPAGFIFCPKLPRDLTHKNALRSAIPGALQFLKQMQGLGGRLGPIFAQLPPHYGPLLLDDLTAFLTAWPRAEAPLALEVRHPDWFRAPHRKYGTTFRMINLIVVLQLLAIIGSRGSVSRGSLAARSPIARHS